MIKGKTRATDRSRSVGRTVRAITRTLARRTGESKAQVMRLNEHAGGLIARSVRESTTADRCGTRIGSWPWRSGKAQGSEEARAAHCALPEGHRADRSSRSRTED